MTRRELLHAAAAPLASAAGGRPNIILVLSDDHHYQALGAAGNPHIRTPNLDRLCREGVYFTSGIVSTSQCAPSRGILLTGLETYQTGLRSNGARTFTRDFGPTAVDQLRRSGYDTVLVGKWHIDERIARCGFHSAPLWMRPGFLDYRNPPLRRGLDGAERKVPGHITDLFTGAAIDVVRSARRPFFLWLAYNAPHKPWYEEAKYSAPYRGMDPRSVMPPDHPRDALDYDWPTYYSTITHVDDGVGRIVAEVKRAGLWDNTILFFLGDNGFMCGARGMVGKVVPYEASIRVPYFVAGGPVANGRVLDMPAASIDLSATWLDLAGVNPAAPLSGRSLRGVIEGGKPAAEAAFAVWDDPGPNALSDHRIIEPYRLIRTRTHKYIRWRSGTEALYAWPEDGLEQRNLVTDPASRRVLSGLKERLAARMRETADPARSWA